MLESLTYEHALYFVYSCWGIGLAVAIWADAKAPKRMVREPVRVRKNEGKRIHH